MSPSALPQPRSPEAHLACVESLSPTGRLMLGQSHPHEDGTRKRAEKKRSTKYGPWREGQGKWMLLNLFQFFSKIPKKIRPDKKPWTAPQNDARIQAPSTTGGTSIIFITGATSDGNSAMHLLLGREV